MKILFILLLLVLIVGILYEEFWPIHEDGTHMTPDEAYEWMSFFPFDSSLTRHLCLFIILAVGHVFYRFSRTCK